MSSKETKFEVHQPEGPNTGNVRQHKHRRRMHRRIRTNRRINKDPITVNAPNNKENPTTSNINKHQDSMKQYQPVHNLNQPSQQQK